MQTQRLITRTTMLTLALACLPLLGGCAQLAAPMSATVMGLQYDTMVQGNSERAGYSAEFAKQQTCGEAAVYRARAIAAADMAKSKASRSSDLADGMRKALEDRGTVLSTIRGYKQRLDERKAALQAASAAFSEWPDRGDNARLGTVIDELGVLHQASQDYSRELLAVASDFKTFAAANPGLVEAAMPGPPNASDRAQAFEQAADNVSAKANEAGFAQFTVPSDMNSQLIDFKWPAVRQTVNDVTDEYEGLMGAITKNQALASNLLEESGSAYAVFDAWGEIEDRFQAHADALQSQMINSTSEISELADESRMHAAEATRNAWLAHQACGGELPPDFPGVENPFDRPRGPVPPWSSTFWDISSP